MKLPPDLAYIYVKRQQLEKNMKKDHVMGILGSAVGLLFLVIDYLVEKDKSDAN